MFLVYIMLVIAFAVTTRLIFVEKDNMKLKARNKLLCRENHKLRLKQEEHENSSKG
jgi:hypothetical protein